jgi:hypothetical protein
VNLEHAGNQSGYNGFDSPACLCMTRFFGITVYAITVPVNPGFLQTGINSYLAPSDFHILNGEFQIMNISLMHINKLMSCSFVHILPIFQFVHLVVPVGC